MCSAKIRYDLHSWLKIRGLLTRVSRGILHCHENGFGPPSIDLAARSSSSGRPPIPRPRDAFEGGPQSGKHLPSQTAGSLPRARGQTPAGERRDPSVHGWSLDSSPGRTRWSASNRRLSSLGIARVSVCSGAGNRGPEAGHACRNRSKLSFGK